MKRLLLSALVVLSLACVAEARGPYRSNYRSPYGGYGSSYRSPIGYGAGGYYTGFGYQPWSTMTYASPGGGAVTQFYGGVMGPGFYMPYTFSGYTPGIYGGYGYGGGY